MPLPQRAPSGTKFVILQLLLKQELTPGALAERLGVTPTAIRQHLSALSAMGLVEHQRMRRGASRPPEVYRLSVEGRRVFPKRYDVLAGELVGALVERLGPDAALDTVRAAARRLASEVAPTFGSTDGEQRWARVLEWLEREFAWEADVADGNGVGGCLRVHQCPFQDVSGRHPAVCAAFFPALVSALHGGATLEHRPDPASPACCAFTVRKVEQRVTHAGGW